MIDELIGLPNYYGTAYFVVTTILVIVGVVSWRTDRRSFWEFRYRTRQLLRAWVFGDPWSVGERWDSPKAYLIGYSRFIFRWVIGILKRKFKRKVCGKI